MLLKNLSLPHILIDLSQCDQALVPITPLKQVKNVLRFAKYNGEFFVLIVVDLLLALDALFHSGNTSSIWFIGASLSSPWPASASQSVTAYLCTTCDTSPLSTFTHFLDDSSDFIILNAICTNSSQIYISSLDIFEIMHPNAYLTFPHQCLIVQTHHIQN